MALTFAKILVANKEGVFLNEFYRRSHSAEENRAREHEAAITIQSAWRGFVARQKWIKTRQQLVRIQAVFRGYRGRRLVEKELINRRKEKQNVFYSQMAVKIQKIWRGYYIRKYEFDYYYRKKYIQQVIKKNEELREYLKHYELEHRQLQEAHKESQKQQHVDRIASKLHHLLGTKNNPGVFANEPVFKYAVENANRSDNKEDLPKITENLLKTSTGLKKYMEEHVGTNRTVKSYKRKDEEDGVPEEKIKKPAAGPFMPLYKIEKLKNRKSKLSLRAQTNFYDVYEHQKEEKRKDDELKISDKPFVPRCPLPPVDSKVFLSHSEPYNPFRYGEKGFRDEHPEKFVGKKPFKSILPPIRSLDDYYD